MEKMARKEENVLEMRLAEETFLWYQGVQDSGEELKLGLSAQDSALQLAKSLETF